MLLTETYRPKTWGELCGQTRAKNILTNMIAHGEFQSVIMYGPPGTGKTTAAHIFSAETGFPIEKLNATTASIADIKTAVKNAQSFPLLLYLDEIQYFNKKQQQSLLSFVEAGTIILIAATTENPYHAIYDALLSRCVMIPFERVPTDEIETRLNAILTDLQRDKDFPAATTHRIAQIATGDVRKAVTTLSLVLRQFPSGTQVSVSDLSQILSPDNMSGFDMDGDEHYSLVSALQKSIRGSDPNAAIFYLARLLEGGDILSPCRRLLVIANEDIGLAYPEAPAIVYALTETAKQLGMPEAAKPLTNAVLLLALSPKCDTAERTYNPAASDVHAGFGSTVPYHLRTTHAKDYRYPHEYVNHYCNQQYLPDDIKHKQYYRTNDNTFEENAEHYWQQVKSITKEVKRNA